MTLTHHDFPPRNPPKVALCWPRAEVFPLMTPASLQTYTQKDLAQMARQGGVRGWHSMRKDQLIRALLNAARSSTAKRPTSKKVLAPARRSPPSKSVAPTATTRRSTVHAPAA